ncbi:protein of unknown function [Shewanella benthica]|uniref:Uncharacterized protein n=1 Tax=Shewanella benthica TaxID=43661 RepID=A0A330LZY2_9GAMM|nr:hypothetical protein [Shewanella benthica]SQH75461.1 protein of unknown function [Shewanella benthica]
MKFFETNRKGVSMLKKYLFLLPKNLTYRSFAIFLCFAIPTYGLYFLGIIQHQPALWQLLFWMFLAIAVGYMTDRNGFKKLKHGGN